MNKIIQSLWIGRPLSLIEQLSINSFLRNGHEYHLYCYDEIKNVPAGVKLREASKILPESEIFCYPEGEGKGSVSAFSNLFRYKLLLDRGGWWVDTDVVCLRPFDFQAALVFASERGVPMTQLASAVIRLPKGHAVARSCYDAARQEDRTRLNWGKTGPVLLDRVVRENGLQDFVHAPEVFCPLDHWNWERLLAEPDPSAPLFTDKSYSIHLWHEQWRRANSKVLLTTGETQTMGALEKLWSKIMGEPNPALNDTTSLAGLMRRYETKPAA